MPNFLDRYLTEPDKSLSGDTYIDPIGTLLIWSAFGREIFQNKINSVSNDVRNYTLNLFHHHLLRKLINDDDVVLSGSLQREYSDKHSLSFKNACLIFLENIFVYSVLRHENENNNVKVVTRGILGGANARRIWEETKKRPTLKFTHKSEGQILVRQLGLGVSGRYKTPLLSIGFFDKSYQYNLPDNQTIWGDVERFIAGPAREPLGTLEGELYGFITNQLEHTKVGKPIDFSGDVPRNLTSAYAKAFAAPNAVGKYAGDFWLRQTGLNQNAAGALLNVLGSQNSEIVPKELVEAAIKEQLPKEEQAKLERIVALEPLLSDCALLFNIIASEKTQSVAGAEKLWKGFNRTEWRLRDCADKTTDLLIPKEIKGSEGERRLIELRGVANAGNFDQQVRKLIEYHKRVMNMRGPSAWLDIDDIGKIRVNARTVPLPEPENRPPGSWQNSYYLHEFSNFAVGVVGNSA